MLVLVVFTWERRPPSPMENNSVLMSSDQGWFSFCDSCVEAVSGALANPFFGQKGSMGFRLFQEIHPC